MEESKKTPEQKAEEIGKKIQNLGCLLTSIFTIPLIGALLFGIVGLIVGAIIGMVIIAGMIGNTKSKEENNETDKDK